MVFLLSSTLIFKRWIDIWQDWRNIYNNKFYPKLLWKKLLKCCFIHKVILSSLSRSQCCAPFHMYTFITKEIVSIKIPRLPVNETKSLASQSYGRCVNYRSQLFHTIRYYLVKQFLVSVLQGGGKNYILLFTSKSHDRTVTICK